jgi:two-component system, OmpR family, sensor histidine kinase VanS
MTVKSIFRGKRSKWKVKKHVKKHHSLRFKMTLTLTVLIFVTIFLLWLFNQTFLETYYIHSKINILDNTYSLIDNSYSSEEGGLSQNDAYAIQRVSETKNVEVYLITDSFVWMFPKVEKDSQDRILSILQNYFFTGINPDINMEELAKEDKYSIFKLHDGSIDANYLELLGRIDNDYIVYMRTNLESIRESVSIANKFLAYAGVLAVILGAVIMFYISNRFTQPVLKLSEIAKKMIDLDFNAKYKVDSKDEIGVLGHCFNSLSEKLEKTILELKSANNELKIDIEKKIQIDEMRQEFVSNVSHELKTPIAIIQGYAEGLKENIHEDEESKEFYCEVIIDEAQKMNQMVKKLISLSKLESGHNQINFERFDIVTVIRSILNSNMILFKQNGITCIFDYHEPIYVWGDEYMVEEVLTNYISNALHHADYNRIIEVKLTPKEDVLRIGVYNTGENIPEEELEKVWIKFYKIDKARTREYDGSGIGLSIVKAIMTAHNQNYGIINHKDGVEFWFELDRKAD